MISLILLVRIITIPFCILLSNLLEDVPFGKQVHIIQEGSSLLHFKVLPCGEWQISWYKLCIAQQDFPWQLNEGVYYQYYRGKVLMETWQVSAWHTGKPAQWLWQTLAVWFSIFARNNKTRYLVSPVFIPLFIILGVVQIVSNKSWLTRHSNYSICSKIQVF